MAIAPQSCALTAELHQPGEARRLRPADDDVVMTKLKPRVRRQGLALACDAKAQATCDAAAPQHGLCGERARQAGGLHPWLRGQPSRSPIRPSLLLPPPQTD